MAKELVVISGKGGTGKTSLAASFAVLAGSAVVADCDVDAADLHLILAPRVRERHEFRSGHEAVIRSDACTRCGVCLADCRFGAISAGGAPPDRGRAGASGAGGTDQGAGAYAVDPRACEGCGVCVRFCPVRAIDFTERVCGEWMVSETRCGPMVHARLDAAAENSGKLVSLVRREARRIAEAEGRPLVVVDGPPGIGCPVIASITGASLVLAVTEPTVSGEHDLERVLRLARHFAIPVAVCVNKWDLNPTATERIEQHARDRGARVTPRVRYDHEFTRAQIAVRAVVESDTPVAGEIRRVWADLEL